MPTGNKGQDEKDPVRKIGGVLQPADARYLPIAPGKIRPNEHNPRLFFNDETIERLAESIRIEGILVPITVYEDKKGDTTHVLLDGERRWRAAKLINLPTMPAWVVPKPSGVANAVRMFNIHMLREEWSEIAVATALEELIKQLGTDSPEELHRITGLSRDRIRNIKIVLAFPRSERQRVMDGELSFNYLVELDKNVLGKLRRAQTDLMGAKESEVRTKFIRKYLDEVDTDPVALRQVGKLIDTAALGGRVGSRARSALRHLIDDPKMTVDEAYEAGAAASVELRRVMRDVDELPSRIEIVLRSSIDPSEAKEFRAALRKLQKAIAAALERAEA